MLCCFFSHVSRMALFVLVLLFFFSFTNLFDHAQAFISSTCSGQLFIMPLGDSLCLVCLVFWFCLRFVYFWFLFCFLFFFRIVMAPLGPCKGSPTVRSLLVLQQYGLFHFFSKMADLIHGQCGISGEYVFFREHTEALRCGMISEFK